MRKKMAATRRVRRLRRPKLEKKDAIWVIGLAVLVLWVGVYVIPLGNKGRQAVFDPLNATYMIDGRPVALAGGRASWPVAPGSAAQAAVQVFGEPVQGDLNGDGRPDAAVILAYDPGGSGTFYYVTAAVNTGNGAQGTNAVLLGDRIAPQHAQITNGMVVANYVERGPNEPMSAPPSMGVSKFLVLQGDTLAEAAPSGI